jgi:hypothetical protein
VKKLLRAFGASSRSQRVASFVRKGAFHLRPAASCPSRPSWLRLTRLESQCHSNRGLS